MTNMKNIITEVRNYLDKEGWKYTFNEEKQSLRAGCRIGGKLSTIKLRIIFRENSFSIYAFAPINADKESRPAVMEYITRVNFNIRDGCFKMDLSDGELMYQLNMNCNGIESLPVETIEEAILLPTFMFLKFGDGLATLMMGFSNPEVEFTKATSNIEAIL